MTEVETEQKLSEEEKKKAEAAKAKKKKKQEEEDEPLWHDLLAASIKCLVLGWSMTMLTLSYVRLPEKLTFGQTIIPIPEQGNIDPTFPASLLGSILAGFGIQAANQKKNNGSNGGGLTEEKLMKILAMQNSNEQVIRVQTPIHIVGGELVKSEKPTKDSNV
tara:strand:- start:19120 stop:19605 length:486 start_codon:yes stop_codon:yes gene_type:complete